MKQSKNTQKIKSKERKEFDPFDEGRKSLNAKFNEKKSSKNWKNNIFEKNDEFDEDYTFDNEEYQEEEE